MKAETKSDLAVTRKRYLPGGSDLLESVSALGRALLLEVVARLVWQTEGRSTSDRSCGRAMSLTASGVASLARSMHRNRRSLWPRQIVLAGSAGSELLER